MTRLPRFFIAALIASMALSSLEVYPAEPREVGEFLQDVAVHRERQQGLPSSDIRDVQITDTGRVVVQTDRGAAKWNGQQWSEAEFSAEDNRMELPSGVTCHQWDVGGDGRLAAATDIGLFEREHKGEWSRLTVNDRRGRVWAANDVRGVAYDSLGRLWFATLAGVGCRQGSEWQFYEGKDGLPYNDFTCCAAAPQGIIWFGTRRGAVRYDGRTWAYRQGKRWLPDDDVRSIAVTPDGTAWFATAGGVGCIERKVMTLEDKAAFYESEIDQYIRRTEFGYTAEAVLSRPGDKSQANHHDSDNDGLWTSMYGASQCFAYAVDGTDVPRQRAQQTFEALKFLQTVTQGGRHSPPRGYVARTIRPTSGPNPNDGRLEVDRRMQVESDRLWKVYQPRWPKSADGKWYWKSDTSSDELDGHYFFYGLYYDLVAETDDEKAGVRQVVRDLTDHLISHDFALIDHDGLPTRWANFRPSSLNHDINWWPERGLNSLSMLSYLSVAAHVTGDARYRDVAQMLMRDHAYHTNAMVPKIQRGIGSGNQSDDEMAFMSFYNLVKYTSDVDLRNQFLVSFYLYWTLEQPERNPFFHFAYAASGQRDTFSDPFQTHDLSAQGDWLDDSIDMLKRLPLDRVDWGHTNSHRIDIVRLPVQQAPGTMGFNRGHRGYRVDGKVLPVDERFFAHWNTDPWQLDYRGNGHVLASGTVFLLPYHMGRYHGFFD